MDAFLPIEISASGLNAQRLRMTIIASNLANVDSTRVDGVRAPYQRREIVMEAQPLEGFDELLAEQLGITESAAGLIIEHSRGVSAEMMLDEITPFREVPDPSHPDADPGTGIVSYPNISVVKEMTDMISASQNYEANLAAMRATIQMIERAMTIAI